MGVKRASACGKTILTGEYAVVFGYPGIAIPSPLRMEVEYEPTKEELRIEWDGMGSGTLGGQADGKVPDPFGWDPYVLKIFEQLNIAPKGILKIRNNLPLGKGMGSSTALIVALCRVFSADEKALDIETHFNPNHSGIDVGVISKEESLKFIKREGMQPITIDKNLLQDTVLIDTGSPDQQTAELVAWVKERSEQEEIVHALETIGRCTERLELGEDLTEILRDHHSAQVTLGVVPESVREFIRAIEHHGEAAKVLGAGSRTGGGGMVLALHKNKNLLKQLADERGYAIVG